MKVGDVILGTKLDTSGIKEDLDNLTDEDIDEMFEGTEKVVTSISDKFKSILSSVFGVSKEIVVFLAKLVGVSVLLGGILLIIGAISKAFSMAVENEEIQARIQYIKDALQNILTPLANLFVKILKWALDLIIQLLIYVGAIIKLITGKNIFKSTDTANKNLKSANKNAKELQKTLTGFDEVNKLNGPSTNIGTANAVANTDLGLPNMEDEVDKKVGKWKEKISELLETTRKEAKEKFVGEQGMAGYFQLGLFDMQKGLATFGNAFKLFAEGDIWGAIKSLSLGALEFLLGIIETIFGLPIKMWKILIDWIKANWQRILLYIKSIPTMIMGLFNKLWDYISEKWGKLAEWFEEHISKPISEKWNKIKETATEVVNKIKEKWEGFKDKVVTFFTNIKDKATEKFKAIKSYIVDKVITPLTDKFDKFKEKIIGVWDSIKQAVVPIINLIIKGINKLIDGLNKISIDIPDWVPTYGGKKWGFNIKKISEIKLAKGGIVNMPGRGVPVGNAKAGENGPEGVIPFTDAQQMEMIGQAIGKYVTINLTNTIKLNTRQIAKEVKNVMTENNFATNGGM